MQTFDVIGIAAHFNGISHMRYQNSSSGQVWIV